MSLPEKRQESISDLSVASLTPEPTSSVLPDEHQTFSSVEKNTFESGLKVFGFVYVVEPLRIGVGVLHCVEKCNYFLIFVQLRFDYLRPVSEPRGRSISEVTLYTDVMTVYAILTQG
jgi:hypothetical protein